MNTRRVGIHLLSTLLLLLWGGVMLYFYVGGRIVHYLPPDGIFRPMVLWSGIGLVVLALYNLATIGAKEADCCEHDHAHDHDHGHDHAHKDGGCDHDHGHGHGHSHEHEHGHGHSHAHDDGHGHAHKAGECCGHDHHHDHGHAHAAGHAHTHDHGPGEHAHGHGDCAHGVGHTDHSHFDADPMKAQRPPGHAHGILEESGAFGRLLAILLLAVPVSYAAVRSPDRFSANAVVNKGLYSQSYGEGARAEQFSLKKDVAATSDTGAVAARQSPASTVAEMPPDPSKGPAPAVNTKEVEKQAAKGGAETKSYGSFSLADLKAQVPQSPEGNFMLEVPELYYTAGDKEVQGVLSGQPIETIAQVLPEKVNNEAGTRLRIFRLLVQCCAADARPYSIPVEFGKPAPTEFKDMSWVKVTGKMTYKKEGDQTVPVIEATNIAPAAEPANAMVY